VVLVFFVFFFLAFCSSFSFLTHSQASLPAQAHANEPEHGAHLAALTKAKGGVEQLVRLERRRPKFFRFPRLANARHGSEGILSSKKHCENVNTKE
jgi:hypothetical protein